MVPVVLVLLVVAGVLFARGLFTGLAWRSTIGYAFRVTLALPLLCFVGLFMFGAGGLAAQSIPELPGQIGLWRTVGTAERHVGRDLYTYMDGGAELYLEYGFQELGVRFYERGNDQLSVELYRMKSTGYGVFTMLRSENGEPLSVADGGFRSGYYFIFSRGPFFCAVTAQSEFADAADAVVQVGKAVAALLPGSDPAPTKVDILPEEGRVPGSEKIIAGRLSLRSVSDALGDSFTSFADGAAARYRRGKEEGTVLAGFLRWRTSAEATAAMNQSADRASKVKASSARLVDGRLSFSDPEGKPVFAVLTGNSVVFVAGEVSPPDGVRELIEELIKKAR